MKYLQWSKLLIVIFIFIFNNNLIGQKPPNLVYGELFTAIQETALFPDSKTFVDCTPKRKVAAILKDYQQQKLQEGFSLEKFVNENFSLQKQPQVINIEKGKSIEKHIKSLWTILKRAQDKKVEGSSLLPLPHPYIVPGGRFTEIYYWDSYFTMLGLKEDGEIKTIENMVDNFAYLINTYGHIPNGNRTYYLSRSQPPFFAMMVQLLAQSKSKRVFKKYLPALQKEYNFWMNGVNKIKNGQQFERVIKLNDGTVLNRYCDNLNIPRQEGYKEDVRTAEETVTEKMKLIRFASEKAMNDFIKNEKARVYKDLRSAAESGWDFSSRWFYEAGKLSTIHTTDFAPVDLNALLFNLESVLIQNGGKVNLIIHEKRKKAFSTYFWHPTHNFYCDFDFQNNTQSNHINAAAYFPVYFLPYTNKEKLKLKKATEIFTKKYLLKPGGIATSYETTQQQWDAPNGWAPLQWMAVMSLEKTGNASLAKDITQRWTSLCKKIYNATGKLTEKYNVVDMTLETGGGEYPNLDGFGWTNGVYLALIKKYRL